MSISKEYEETVKKGDKTCSSQTLHILSPFMVAFIQLSEFQRKTPLHFPYSLLHKTPYDSL